MLDKTTAEREDFWMTSCESNGENSGEDFPLEALKRRRSSMPVERIPCRIVSPDFMLVNLSSPLT
jgi:hypothetical protein